jgi:hypothetical protein
MLHGMTNINVSLPDPDELPEESGAALYVAAGIADHDPQQRRTSELTDPHERDVGESPSLIEARQNGRSRNRLTEHFVIEEFDCNDGTHVLPGRAATYRYLCRTFLEPMRRKYGRCIPTSGYRTRAYNDAIGGEPGSYHVNEDHDRDDVAADVTFARGTPAEWAAMARRIRERERNGRGGIGRYDSQRFIHIDTRDFRSDW